MIFMQRSYIMQKRNNLCSGMISVYSVSLGMSDRYKFDIVY